MTRGQAFEKIPQTPIETDSENYSGWTHLFNPAQKAYAFSRLKGERSPLYMGFEYETNLSTYVNSSNVIKGIHRRVGTYANFRDEYGAAFEMVTAPCTLDFHKAMLDKHLFKPSLNTHFKGHSSNGMHVHVDKEFFTEEQILKLCMFINDVANNPLINHMSGNRIGRGVQWCKPRRIKVTKKKVFGRTVKKPELDVNVGSPHPKCFRGMGGKYVAINTNLPNTVEIRIFSVGKTSKHIYRNLEFVDAVCRFVKVTATSNLSMYRFFKYLRDEKNKGKYPNLLNDKGIKDLIEGTDTAYEEMREIILAERREELIKKGKRK